MHHTIIFKISKIRQKFKNDSIVKKAQAVMLISLNAYILGEPCIILKRLNENCKRRYILQLLYTIPLFQKCQKLPKIHKKNPIVKKSTNSQPCD